MRSAEQRSAGRAAPLRPGCSCRVRAARAEERRAAAGRVKCGRVGGRERRALPCDCRHVWRPPGRARRPPRHMSLTCRQRRRRRATCRGEAGPPPTGLGPAGHPRQRPARSGGAAGPGGSAAPACTCVPAGFPPRPGAELLFPTPNSRVRCPQRGCGAGSHRPDPAPWEGNGRSFSLETVR